MGEDVTTYTVSKFDSSRWTKNCDGWLIVAYRVPPRVAVQHIRELESLGYDRETSIYVERDEVEKPIATRSTARQRITRPHAAIQRPGKEEFHPLFD